MGAKRESTRKQEKKQKIKPQKHYNLRSPQKLKPTKHLRRKLKVLFAGSPWAFRAEMRLRETAAKVRMGPQKREIKLFRAKIAVGLEFNPTSVFGAKKLNFPNWSEKVAFT